MDHERTAKEVIPVGPDLGALYPLTGQLQVLTALRQDVESGLHLLYVIGPPGSGKTELLRALQRNLDHCLTGFIGQPMSGSLLKDLARSMRIEAPMNDESVLRRQLVMKLSTAELQRKPIVQIIDDADSIALEDLDLLLHFFPAGHVTLILAGAREPDEWHMNASGPSAGIRFDRTYRIAPLTPDETEGYIRYCLHDSELTGKFLRSTDIMAIHRQGNGLPGPVDRIIGEAFSQYAGRASAPERIPEPAADTPTDEPLETSIHIPMMAPAREIPAGLVVENTDRPLPGIAPSGPSPRASRSKEQATGTPDDRERRIRRSVRRWRMTAGMTALLLLASLSRDIWMERIPMDENLVARVTGLFAGPRASMDAAQSPETPQLSRRSPATTVQPQSGGTESRSDFAAMFPSASIPEAADSPSGTDASAPITTVTIPPGVDTTPGGHHTVPTGDAAQEQVEPPSAQAGTDADATSAIAATPPADAATAPASQRTAKESGTADNGEQTVSLTRAQREKVARLYTDRALYELRKGDLDAALASIRYGLASDPGNRELLEMRARATEARRADEFR